MNTWTVKAHQLRQAQAAQLVAILNELTPDELADKHRYIASNGGDHQKLRGIPAIGRGVAGAIPGTSPHHSRT